MARNPIIYGLADEIFVAESSEKGGTWSGVMDGLRKGRKIYVRKPEPNEKNANILLIQKGAIAVDYNGIENSKSVYTEQSTTTSIVQEKLVTVDNINDRILKVFNGGPLSAKEILDQSGLDWSTKKLTILMQKMKEIEIVKKGRTNQFILKVNQVDQPTLF
jgi:predicted Rossmann fold nucleotide-binding protein DprA/Smf involved in DNA uptake